MEARPRKVVHHITHGGDDPFDDWMDRVGADIFGLVVVRLKRVEKGLLGNYHGVGEGVCEFIFDFGPGYRVYFGQDGDRIVLLTGGKKNTQAADIQRAKILWREYKNA